MMEEGSDVTAQLETAQQTRVRWRSLYVMYFSMFLMSLGFSIVLTGVWPYLDKLDPSAGKEFLGVVVAAHPLGQMVFAPLVGWWSARARSAAAPLRGALALFVAGHVLYALLPLVTRAVRWWLAAARLMVGASAASVAAARAYVAAATTLAERSQVVAMLSLAQVLGFAAGPAIQAAVTPLGSAPSGSPALDMYTAAGWLNAALGLCNLALFAPKMFVASPVAAAELALRTRRNQDEVLRACRPHRATCWTLVIAFFALLYCFVLLETLATSLTMDQFGWDKTTALRRMGVLMSVGAVVACATFAAIGPLSRRFEERALLVYVGFPLTVVGCLLCVPMARGPAPPKGPEPDAGGCPPSQAWCLTERALALPQFLVSYACVSLGYPLANTLIQTIFCKALGPRPQGVWQGVLTGAGCLSRALGPLAVSVIYARWGPTATFSLTAGLAAAATVALRAVYGRLVTPEPEPKPPPEDPATPLVDYKPAAVRSAPDDLEPAAPLMHHNCSPQVLHKPVTSLILNAERAPLARPEPDPDDVGTS